MVTRVVYEKLHLRAPAQGQRLNGKDENIRGKKVASSESTAISATRCSQPCAGIESRELNGEKVEQS